jgi:hypothetical protein
MTFPTANVSIANLDSAATYGWKVKIKYHETFGKNWFSNRGETNYFVNEVEVLDKNLQGWLCNFWLWYKSRCLVELQIV